VDTAFEEDVNGITRKLVVIGSQGRNQIQGVYGQVDLPVLAKEHKLSELYAQAAHETGHEGVISTLHRTRRKVWIINRRALADSIKARCTECRLKEKNAWDRRWDLSRTTEPRWGPCSSPWRSTCSGPWSTSST
jgi:hypothetical protein